MSPVARVTFYPEKMGGRFSFILLNCHLLLKTGTNLSL